MNGKKIELFVTGLNGVEPLQDEILNDRIEKAVGSDKNSEDFQRTKDQVQVYFRAFGRIMLHSLMTDHVLPHNLLPSIFLRCK